MSRTLTRRQFLLTSMAAASSAALAACGATPTATPVPPTATKPPAPGATQAPAVVPTAAPTTPPVATIPKGGTIRIGGSGGKAKYFTPLWFMGTTGWDNSMPHIWPPLIMFDGEGVAQPFLAEKYEYASDAKSVTFTLPKTAKWSDGHPLTADDVKFTWETLIKYMAKIGTGWAFVNPEQIVGGKDASDGKADSVSGIQVVDAQTVRFVLTSPDTGFVRYLWRSIAPKHMYEGAKTFEDIENNAFTKNPTIHSGAFKLAKFVEAQYIEMDAVRPYWNNTPNLHEVKYIDKAIMYNIGDSNVKMTKMEAGELDIFLLAGAEQVDRAEKLKGFKTYHKYGFGRTHMPVNTKRPAMKDKRVRQAMMYALDREALNAITQSGRGKIMYNPVNFPEWAVNPNLDPYKRDLNKAKALLKDVGWSPNQEVIYLSFATGEDKQAAWFQQCLAEAGMKVTIRREAYTALADILAKGDFDVWTQGGGFIYANPADAAEQWSCSSWYGTTDGYCNSELDELIKKSRATTDQKEAQRVAWRLAEILQDELPSLWLLESPVTTLVSERVGNFIPGPVVDAGGTWLMTDYYVKPV